MKCWVFSFNGDGFYCTLDALYESLEIIKLQFFIKKY
jgi:hypothetical protein